jgi:hypothetical protein
MPSAAVNHMPPGGHHSRSAYDGGFIPHGSHWGPSGRLGLLAIAVEMAGYEPVMRSSGTACHPSGALSVSRADNPKMKSGTGGD